MAFWTRPIQCVLAIFAQARAETRPPDGCDGSPSSPLQTVPPLSLPERAYANLKTEFPGEGYFPVDFHWACPCHHTGFPGCENMDHFLTRVYLALLDYHQVRETCEHSVIGRGRYDGRDYDRVLRVDQFTPERRRQLETDMELAFKLLYDMEIRHQPLVQAPSSPNAVEEPII